MAKKQYDCPRCGRIIFAEENDPDVVCPDCAIFVNQETEKKEFIPDDNQPKKKECPFCAEEINYKAKKCKHCGEMIEAEKKNVYVAKKRKDDIGESRVTGIASSGFIREIDKDMGREEKVIKVAELSIMPAVICILDALLFSALTIFVTYAIPVPSKEVIAMGAVPVAIFLLMAVYFIAYYLTTKFTLTNKRLIIKTGFLELTTVEFNLSKIEGVSMSMGVWGRIFNYGKLGVSGTGTTTAFVHSIKNPIKFRLKVLEAKETL